jgi:thiol-disulfide isomerase/thioredoxin
MEKTKIMTIKYYDNYQPALKTGAYIIEVEQTLKSDDLKESFNNSADLIINKETKSLTTQAIHSVYPPIDGQGNFDSVLPKIVLQDASLPWQNSVDEKTPTLALLLFEVEELAIEDWTKVSRTGARLEGEKMFVDIPIDYLQNCFPKQAELPFLAHVQTTNEIDYSATIFSNRLPKSNSRNIVHLVNLAPDNYRDDYNQLNQNITNQKVSFQTLTSWEFYCEAAKEEFEILAKNLVENHQLLRLNIDKNIENETIKTAFEGGFVPLKHETQQGEHTTAFYRSPLVPNLVENQNLEANFSAESAMVYDKNTGIFDLSYSVAWQTGRLLALSDAYF